MKHDQFIIRSIENSDDKKVKDLIIKTLIEYGANREGFAAKDEEIENLTDFYVSCGGEYFVVLFEDRVVGGAGIAPLKGDTKCWELQKMYLDSEFRGKGLGNQLMEKCLEVSKEKGIEELYLETLDSMKEANFLYQKFGFQKLSNPKGNTGHFGCDSYYLKKIDG